MLVYSGDNVVRDEEGYLYFVARRDELIKTAGFRVSPTEVEAGVLAHPEISAAVAFGHPNIEVGEDIVCAYTTIDNKPLSDRSLQQRLKSLLPRHMVPAYLIQFEEFAVTGNKGKINRKSVKELARKWLGLDSPPLENQSAIN